MIDSGIVGENDNVNETISDDIFDGIIDILDFPMEDTDAGGELEELQVESPPLNDFSALPSPFSGNSCIETSNLRKVAVSLFTFRFHTLLFITTYLCYPYMCCVNRIVLLEVKLLSIDYSCGTILFPVLVELKEDEWRWALMLKNWISSIYSITDLRNDTNWMILNLLETFSIH